MCFDLRKPDASTGGCFPTESSIAETSHHDPVSDIYWISSKTGHQCVSVSTDGKMMWWDTRKLTEPLDSINLCSNSQNSGIPLGACCLEYNTEAGPTKYLVGTELGTVISVNLRNRKMNNGVTFSEDSLGKKHHGPIYSIQRNPIHNKFFMTIGDWTAKFWTEDLKSPIISTKYHDSYLTGGCWSPVRAGVFYTITANGNLHAWDFHHRQNESVLTYNIGRISLSSIAAQGNSQVMSNLLAVGDENGTVSLLEVCKSLSQPQKDEKANILHMFERETRKERNLEARERELKRTTAQNTQNEEIPRQIGQDVDCDAIIREIDEKFRKLLEDESKIKFDGNSYA
jgi:dynein intermediate chain 2